MSINRSSRKAARQSSNLNARTRSAFYHRISRFEPLEDRRMLANVTVTILTDSIDFNDGKTSLREAIFATNTVPGPDTIDFAPSFTANGPATILLTQGELKITDSLTINGAGASLLTIDASGNDPTPEQNNRDGSRVFNINDGKSFSSSDVTLVGLALTGGDVSTGGAIISSENLSVVDSAITGNSAATGGGVYIRGFSGSSGKLTITRSVIQNNSASGGGGGVFANASAGALAIIDSQFLGNVAGSDGGGLYCDGFRSQVVVTDSLFNNNTAGGDGGGMLVTRSTTTINSTSVHDNYAGRGGGGILASGNLIVSDSSIIGNSANSGFATVSPHGGGGISAGSFVLTGTTISGNSSRSLGGGIFGSGIITDCTITNNSATTNGGGIQAGIGKLTVTNTAIRNNSAAGGGGIASGGALVVVNSAISGNFANGYPLGTYYRNGAGIRCNGSLLASGTTISGNSSKYDGGGIWAGAKADVTITNSTVSGNSASVGAGLWATTSASISHSTVARNSAQILGGGLFVQDGALQLQNSIVGENTASAGPDVTGLIGTTIAPRYSLIGWNANSGLVEAPVGFPDANGNLVGGPLHGVIYGMLGNLTDNGGITLPDGVRIFTISLSPGSPAINAGDPAATAGVDGVPASDQRGTPFTRVYGGRIDIGAFEFQPTNRVLGDFNRDGLVDASDYTLFRKQQLQTVAPGSGADANGDGVVNNADYLVWKATFGVQQSQLSPAVAVPPAVGLGEKTIVAQTEQAPALSQATSDSDSGLRSITPKTSPLESEHPGMAMRKPRRVLLSRSGSPDFADSAHHFDLAIEVWRGLDRGSRRYLVLEQLGESDCKQASSESKTSLAPSVDAAGLIVG